MKGRSDLKVFLVDDHEIILHGLGEYIEAVEGFSVVGKATSGGEALRMLESIAPNVAMLDVRLPDMDGITLCREIRTTFPGVRCLMLSSYASQAAIIDAILAGASGYVLKEARLAEVVECVRAVGAGETLLDASLTKKVLERVRADGQQERPDSLTTQEHRVFDLMATGATNREIAEQIDLAEQTIKNYVSVILTKLGMESRMRAVLYSADLKRAADKPRWSEE